MLDNASNNDTCVELIHNKLQFNFIKKEQKLCYIDIKID